MKRTFTDTAGHTWSLSIGLFTAGRIKDLTDGRCDFVDTSRVQGARNALIELSEDVELCGRVLWLMCESQAKELGISESEFADRFNLDVLMDAQTTLTEALIDFFPSRSRDALRRATEIARNAYDREMEKISDQAEAMAANPDFAAMIESAIRGAMSGSSQDLRSVDPLTSSVALRNSR